MLLILTQPHPTPLPKGEGDTFITPLLFRTYAKRQNPPPQSPPKGGKFHFLALWERVGVRVLRKSSAT